jgi:hypothetical protein
MNSRADYAPAPGYHNGTYFIKDLDLGNKSVTNDAERVVEELVTVGWNCPIVYQDSMGEWCELVHEDDKFVGFAPHKGPQP